MNHSNTELKPQSHLHGVMESVSTMLHDKTFENIDSRGGFGPETPLGIIGISKFLISVHHFAIPHCEFLLYGLGVRCGLSTRNLDCKVFRSGRGVWKLDKLRVIPIIVMSTHSMYLVSQVKNRLPLRSNGDWRCYMSRRVGVYCFVLMCTGDMRVVMTS
ncbi:hypothetical protein COCSADRAFT_263365 [Bipolaris sorokiniana ND90Pr]|uniref:Uncharacterized protein n=1 Tax=Cochliobolus sativus (strain ND90Pr / ATCC 201652) TaxID=665912 RepID=M2RVL1_COCSN|nr:uncharacterized protein COCSADRAFT_263365 [Bipolaris sorokiniana ND90Pr]EMD59088.1 hypothetical protein COCSADRAFT_263365 [Bipolaris sorokiniana ND90Pr]